MTSRAVTAIALVGVALLIAAAVVVFAFGRHDPSPPSLQDEPNGQIPGQILYRNNEDCLVAIEASGRNSREVYCGSPQAAEFRSDENFVWLDEKTIGYLVGRPPGNASEIIAIDIETREETPTGRMVEYPFFSGSEAISPTGDSVRVDGGEVFLFVDGRREKITSFDIADSGYITPILWSPDSQWILLSYYPPRGDDRELWVISRDGSVRGTLATDVESYSASWMMDSIDFPWVTPELKER